MKRVKILSIAVIVLSVIALGIFMGKQTFQYFENASVSSSQRQDSPSTVSMPEVKTQVLYSSGSGSDKTLPPQPKVMSRSEGRTVPVENETTIATPSAAPGLTFDPSRDKWVAYANTNLNVRSGPSTDTKVAFRVMKGTKGTVVKQESDWTEIRWDFNRKNGWVRNDLLLMGPETIVTRLVNSAGNVSAVASDSVLTAAQKVEKVARKVSVVTAKPSPPAETVRGFVAGGELPEKAIIYAEPMATIRSGPTTRHSRVGRLPKGLPVRIKSVRNMGKHNWFEIVYADGKREGWTREDNLRFE